MSDGLIVIGAKMADSISQKPQVSKRPNMHQLPLLQQAKRRKRNLDIAKYDIKENIARKSETARPTVEVFPPLSPTKEDAKLKEETESEKVEVGQLAQIKDASQTTIEKGVASIPRFKTTRRTSLRNLSAAAKPQRVEKDFVDIQNSSSIPAEEVTKLKKVTETETREVPPVAQINVANKSYASQTSMHKVVASITSDETKGAPRKLSAAAQLKKGFVDLQNPSSILARTNLRGILNKDTFASLPPLYQQKLLQLLPEVDRCPDDSGELSDTALTNEFFSLACHKWTERLAAGEFTPEYQQKVKDQTENNKKAMDPWKVKHFEPFWGRKDESISLGASTSSEKYGVCSSSAAPLKRKLISSAVPDEDAPPKKRMADRKLEKTDEKETKEENC